MSMRCFSFGFLVHPYPLSDRGTKPRGWQHSQNGCTQPLFLLKCFVLPVNIKSVLFSLSVLKSLTVDVTLSSVFYKQSNSASLNSFERELPIHSQRLKPLVNIFSVSLI